MSTPHRSVEGFLSRRAQSAWPSAIVYHRGGSEFVLERVGYDPVGLGKNFHEARQAVDALVKAHLSTTPKGPAPNQG